MTDTSLSCNCRTFNDKGIGIGVVEKDFSKTKAPLTIFAMGDIHGSQKALDKVQTVFDKAEEIGARILITGDLLDNRIKDSKSFAHGAESPHKEIDRVYDLFSKYKHLVDGIVAGNHDERSFKYSGEDTIRRMCLSLGIPYHPDAIVIVYRVGSASYNGHRHDSGPVIYTVFMSHSARAGRKEGSKLQKVADFKDIIKADVMLAGHSHDLSGCKGAFIDISKKGVLNMREQVFINCGSFQDYVGYMVNKNYAPSPQGYATVYLDHTTHKIGFQV